MTGFALIAVILIALTALPIAAVAALLWRHIMRSLPDEVTPDYRLLAAIMGHTGGNEPQARQ